LNGSVHARKRTNTKSNPLKADPATSYRGEARQETAEQDLRGWGSGNLYSTRGSPPIHPQTEIKETPRPLMSLSILAHMNPICTATTASFVQADHVDNEVVQSAGATAPPCSTFHLETYNHTPEAQLRGAIRV